MQKFDEAAYRDFAAVLRARVAAHAADWTGGNESDPGIALIELFALSVVPRKRGPIFQRPRGKPWSRACPLVS